jgi:hypothetical protein
MRAQNTAAGLGERRGDPNTHFLVETALRYRNSYGDTVARSFLLNSHVPDSVIARVLGAGPNRH